MRCGCGASGCSCVIKPAVGSTITVSGSGSAADPYLLGNTAASSATSTACLLYGNIVVLPAYTSGF